MLEAVVIGAGQAGLAASFHLRARGVDHVVLERDRIGETWRSQRWASFRLNTPDWMSRLPGEPEADASRREDFLSAEAFVTRLVAYAERHHLPVRTGASVSRVTRAGGGRAFRVEIATDGATETLEARSVIVASGIQNIPRVPAFAASLPTPIHQLHTAGYRSPSQLPPGAVLVVGSAQSGVQIAEDLLAAGRTVYLCTSAVGRLRRRAHGRDSVEWLVRMGFIDMTPEQLPDPTMLARPWPQISGVGPRGHTVSLQHLAAQGVILLGRPTRVDGTRLQLDDTVGANIAFGDLASAELNAAIERAVQASGLDVPPLEPDPADDPHPDPASVHSPTELDLDAAGISSIVWATGFGGDFGHLDLPVLDERGQPVHDRGAAPVPGVRFLGFPWLTKRKSGIIRGVDEDGAAAADAIVAHLAQEDRPG
jgi:putative flavoprotein involved in K+ transport